METAGCKAIVRDSHTGAATDRSELDALLGRLEACDTFVARKLTASTAQRCRGFAGLGVSKIAWYKLGKEAA